MHGDAHACDLLATGRPDPCIIVIFGATGDLTRRKLIPALYSLHARNRLPESFAVVGCGRSRLDSEQFRAGLAGKDPEHGATGATGATAATAAPAPAPEGWDEFAAHLYYYPLSYDEQGFAGLTTFLLEIDRKHQTLGNRVFDLAVPPSLHQVITTLLGRTAAAAEHGPLKGWARIVIEKPFGHDLDSARKLNSILLSHFAERQIFRIDHYLAKETVQNVLILRFANIVFEPLWNNHYIDYVGIIAAEQLGVGTRAGYYEQAGVLRDMFQNHMMQLLVLTAMEPPWRFEAGAIQDEKAKVIRSLRAFSPGRGSRLHLGQYGPGMLDNRPVPGYREEKGVAPDSLTPTFALMELYVDNWRWRDVPFYLISGKRLPRKQTRIIVQFREAPHQLFRQMFGDTMNANRLIIESYPEESIKLSFQSKSPGPAICLRSMTMDFVYGHHYRDAAEDAYSRVLLDCMSGDHTLFWRQDGIELSWSFLTRVLNECENCQDRHGQLEFYPAGTPGPQSARKIMQLLQAEHSGKNIPAGQGKNA